MRASSWAMACAVCWMGCVGDSTPTTNDAGVDADSTGTVGHACYGNGSCNAGLTCVSNVCVDLASDAGSDAAKTDASDAGGGCDAGQPYPNLNHNCSAGSPYTCLTTSGLVCDSNAAACTQGVQQLVNCTDPTFCTGEPCCLTASQTFTLGCPGTVSLNPSEDLTTCGSAGVCGQGQTPICTTDSQCTQQKKCHLVAANGVQFGVCQ